MAVPVVVACLILPRVAGAQLGQDGDPITSSDYTLDLYSGVVQGSAQMIGLGGAFVAIAEGVDGSLVNPVAPAVRPGYSVDGFDYWLGVGVTLPFSIDDFYNTGGAARVAGADEAGFIHLVPAANVQFGRLGIGASVELQSMRLRAAATTLEVAPPELFQRFMTIRLQAAYQFFSGQLLLGAGGKLLLQRTLIGRRFDTEELFSAFGVGFEVGALYRPNRERYRLALAFESQIETRSDATSEDVLVNGFYVPSSAYQPWEGRLGFAYQWGDRPLNAVWRSVDEVVDEEVGDLWSSMSEDERALYTRETYRRLRREFRAWGRRYLLLSTALHITGPTRNAVTFDSLLLQVVQRSGDEISISPRLGLETELWPNWVRLRYGNYLEPSRVEITNPRFHWTVGLDFKLGWWNVFGVWPEDYLWKLALATDLAREYSIFTFSIGGWY